MPAIIQNISAAPPNVKKVLFGTILVQLAFMPVLWNIEAKALRTYTVEESTIFSISPRPDPRLQGNCLQEYTLLHYTFIGSMVSCIGYVVFVCLAIIRPTDLGRYGVAVMNLIAAVLNCGLAFIGVWGMITEVFQWNHESIEQCEALHNSAWWIYVGIASVACCLLCCLSILLSLKSCISPYPCRIGCSGREPTAVAPAVEEIRYEQLLGQAV